MPQLPHSGTHAHAGLPFFGDHPTDESPHYYSATIANAATDLPAMYDVTGQQYRGDYFPPFSSTLPHTPLETPPYSLTPIPALDSSHTTQNSNMGTADCQNTGGSKWKSLFNVPRPPRAHSLSPTAPQPSLLSRSDSGLYAAKAESARRQSTDTASVSARSMKSGSSPVSPVLVSTLPGTIQASFNLRRFRHIMCTVSCMVSKRGE